MLAVSPFLQSLCSAKLTGFSLYLTDMITLGKQISQNLKHFLLSRFTETKLFLSVILCGVFILVRLAEASYSTPSNFTLHEDRLRQSEEPGSKLLRLLRSSY